MKRGTSNATRSAQRDRHKHGAINLQHAVRSLVIVTAVAMRGSDRECAALVSTTQGQTRRRISGMRCTRAPCRENDRSHAFNPWHRPSRSNGNHLTHIRRQTAHRAHKTCGSQSPSDGRVDIFRSPRRDAKPFTRARASPAPACKL